MRPESTVEMIASLREEYAEARDPAERLDIGSEIIYLENALRDWMRRGGYVPENIAMIGW